MVPILTKKCTKCKTIKPITEFYKDKQTKDKHGRWCKKCAYDNSINWYRDNKPKHNIAQNKRHRKHKLEYINLKGGECQICGYNKCIAALDFHHAIGDKEKQIALATHKVALKELDKCILVCANCHREIHYND